MYETEAKTMKKSLCGAVIRGCMAHHQIEEITILDGHRVLFSGSFAAFYTDCDISMLTYRKQILNAPIEAKTVHHEKLFIFLAPQEQEDSEIEERK